MPVVWDIATSKKVTFAYSVDARQALSTGQYTAVAPGGAEAAYAAERAGDTPQLVFDTTERARLGGPLSSNDRDILGPAWVEVETDPLPTIG